MELKFEIEIKIQKPIKDVFDAVYNPQKLQKYFTTKSARGEMKDGSTVFWEFADFPGEFPVYVKKVIPDKVISFEWETQEGGYKTFVEMNFESLDPDLTLVKISESGWRENKVGLESSYGNCQGWMHMACCLKAFLEYDINLRKGSF